MKFIVVVILAMCTYLNVRAQYSPDTTSRHPWIAAAEVTAVNALVMGYDHLFVDAPWYKVSIHSLKDNIQPRNWWWDKDYFDTNAINHPYHGALYYTAARSNGLDIGTASLYTLGGSLVWEVICESEHPAINDLITTTVGGIALGEPMHRISNCVLDDSKRGIERVGRELLATLIDPMNGLNRLLRGQSWRVGPRTNQPTDINVSVETGVRYTDISNLTTVTTAAATLDVSHGDVLGSEGSRPFDYFTLQLTAVAGQHQALINTLCVGHQLWSRPLTNKAETNAAIGIYNYYDYHNVTTEYNANEDRRRRKPYCYLEIGAIGPGIAYRYGKYFQQQLVVNGIALGCLPSARANTAGIRRGYSYASGYGIRLNNNLSIGKTLQTDIALKASRLFNWDDYYANDDRHSTTIEHGHATTLTLEPAVKLTPLTNIGISLRARYFWYRTEAPSLETQTTHSWEVQGGLQYQF